MRAVMIAVGSSVLLAAIALNSADAAPICKNGHFYYGGSEFHHDKIHAEASAVRATSRFGESLRARSNDDLALADCPPVW